MLLSIHSKKSTRVSGTAIRTEKHHDHNHNNHNYTNNRTRIDYEKHILQQLCISSKTKKCDYTLYNVVRDMEISKFHSLLREV